MRSFANRLRFLLPITDVHSRPVSTGLERRTHFIARSSSVKKLPLRPVFFSSLLPPEHPSSTSWIRP